MEFKLMGIIMKCIESILLLFSCVIFNIAVSDLLNDSDMTGKIFTMWIGTCSYFWIPLAYIVLVYFEKGPDRILNLCCCVCFALLALAAGAILIDDYKDAEGWTDEMKERISKALAAGSFNILVAIVYLADGIYIFMQGED